MSIDKQVTAIELFESMSEARGAANHASFLAGQAEQALAQYLGQNNIDVERHGVTFSAVPSEMNQPVLPSDEQVFDLVDDYEPEEDTWQPR